MNKTENPKTLALRAAMARHKAAKAVPTHVRTADGYKCLSAGLAGPANPVLSETDAARLKAVLFS